MDGADLAHADLVLRAAGPEDAAALTELFVAAREAAYPAMPRSVHTPEEVRAWFGQILDGGRETWLAERDGGVAGFLVLDRAWLDSIYVRPDLTGAGVGAVLLDLAKSLRPDGWGLWVFESNEGARRFYRRHGLVELRHTDGSGNEEGEPDVEMAWLGSDPAATLRTWIGEVDRDLADLAARRELLIARLREVTESPR